MKKINPDLLDTITKAEKDNEPGTFLTLAEFFNNVFDKVAPEGGYNLKNIEMVKKIKKSIKNKNDSIDDAWHSFLVSYVERLGINSLELADTVYSYLNIKTDEEE